MESIIVYTSLILSIITMTTLYFYMLGEDNRKEKIIYKENKKDFREPTQAEQRKELYLQLANLTTGEVLQFKNKNDFIRNIQGYDTIKHFLKGTESENINQLIEWYYPGFKRLEN